ncbi:hypothetical protein Bbelb_131480 [Branchiostoma belcheri]|nr:hypothetical protein Bbelb_131480 [Branchiostoma belcheri]
MSIQGVRRYFIFIKNKVSSDWKDLAWCLGFETPDIDNIEGKRRDDKSRCMELLQEWHKRKGNEATMDVLMEALKNAQLQLVVDSLKGEFPELNEKPKSSTSSYTSDMGKAENIESIRKEIEMLEEKNSKALLEQKAEMNKKIQQLQETIKEMETRNEELLTAKQAADGGSQLKDSVTVQHMSDQQSTDKPTATTKEQVKQSVVQLLRREEASTNVRPIRVGQPWVRKVTFGGEGSGRGEFQGPYGVAVSQDNEVYIADYVNGRIQVFTMDGVYIREFTPTLPGETGEKLRPEDVAVDRNDNLWVVSGDHVVQYSRKGTCSVTIDLPRVDSFRGITVSMATEQVIVTEYDGQNGRLRVFNQDGSEVGTYGSGHRSPKPWWPRYVHVTVDGEGNILFTDSNNHCVHVLDREGNFKFKFGSEGSDKSQLKNPQGICVDWMGNIIVADSGNGCVKMFDNRGRFLSYIGSGIMLPWAVTVSPGRDVVATDWEDDTVSVWTHLG